MPLRHLVLLVGTDSRMGHAQATQGTRALYGQPMQQVVRDKRPK